MSGMLCALGETSSWRSANMDRKLLIFFVVLSVTTTSSSIPITGQQRSAEPPSANSEQNSPRDDQRPEQKGERGGTHTNSPNQQGANNVSVTVEVPRAEPQRADGGKSSKDEKCCGGNDNPIAGLITALASVAQAFAAFVLIGLTGALVWVGWNQWKTSNTQAGILDRTLLAQKVIERAYVTLSHHPPGLQKSDYTHSGNDTDSQNVYDVDVHIGVKNLGNTPATVTRTLIQFLLSDELLPDMPPYRFSDAKVTSIHIVKGDDFTIHGFWQISSDAFSTMRKNPKMQLYILAFAEYIDRFGAKHRVGYGRVYNEGLDYRGNYEKPRGSGRVDEDAYATRSNLPFITKPGYNFDIEIDEQGNPKKA